MGMGLIQKNEIPKRVAVVITDDEVAEVDAILDEGKKLRGSLDGLSKEELIAKYNEALTDDEMGTYFANKKLKSAIEFVLLEKEMLTAEEIAELRK